MEQNTQEQQEKVFKKKVFGVVLFLGLITIIIGIWQIYHNLTSPFKVKESKISGVITENIYQGAPASLDYLKTKDTDSDGLTDYDELYDYKTSPYLADSDSDGIDDRQELESEEDPNCPKGKNCLQASLETSETAGLEDSQLASLDPDNVSVDYLRQTLIESGAPEAVVNNLEDEELREMYREVLAEEGISLNENVNASSLNTGVTDYSNISLEQLENLEAPEIRELLKSSGVGEDILDQLDDETLEAIYYQTLSGELEALQEQTEE